MAETIIDFEGMQLLFPNTTPDKSKSGINQSRKEYFYVGQLVTFKLKIPVSKLGLEKLKSWDGKRSPNSAGFEREILSTLEIKCSLDHSEYYRCRDVTCCTVLNSYDESDSPAKEDEAYLSEGRTFVVPLQIRMADVPQNCGRVKLIVEVKTIPKRVPEWLSSPSRTGHDKQNVPESRYSKLERVLNIIHTPVLNFQQKTVAGKHLILLKATNTSTCRLWVADCSAMPEPCPKTTGQQSCGTCKRQDDSADSRCVVHGNMVKLVSTTQSAFPADLQPYESLSLVYVMQLNNDKEPISKEDISLVAHIKWNVWKRRHGACVTTTYSLPTLKLKQAPFVMSASCDTDRVHKGHSECSYGSTVQAQVRFEALSSGIFELCKHMKINLRYTIPSMEPGSRVDSPGSMNRSVKSDDHVLSASEELWRDRRGSGSSFNEPPTVCAEERRMSFANKSYSVGDLAPVLSTDSDNTGKLTFTHGGNLQQSPKRGGLDTARPITPNKHEQMLLNPANFIKNSYKLLVL